MSDNIEVIGIDHGWMMMKTASQVFKASAEEISTEPAFFDNILEYNGKYYEIGCKRVVVKEMDAAPVLPNITLKCGTCKRTATFKKYTEAKLTEISKDNKALV